MDSAAIKAILERNATGKAHKASFWNNHWQLVHEYFNQRKADFTNVAEPGAFLNSDVWTGRPALAAETASSAMLGIVWPDNHSFAVVPYGDDLDNDPEVKEWFEQATEQMQNDMDDPMCGLSLALDEVILDYLISGTPALMVEEGTESTYGFESYSVQQFSLEEGPSGAADTFYIEKSWTIRNLVSYYGIEKVSQKSREAFNNGKTTDSVTVLHAICPRPPGKKGGLPYMSVHLEVETKHPLRESGYNELPIFAPRNTKRINEKYGRSQAMRALPDVLQLNEQWEMISMAVEKIADPALYTFFSDTINTSAGALNALSWNEALMRQLGTNKPIGQVQDVGDIRPLDGLIERLEQVLNDHFMIDRLIDQNNDTVMTAREYMGRQSIRQMSLRSPLSRLLAELFDPMITRCFNIGLRAGKFGYAEGSAEYNAAVAVMGPERVRKIPRKIVELQGRRQRVYRIRYFTPAARERRADEAQGIMQWYQFAGEVAASDRTVMDIPNTKRTLDILADIWHVPNDCKNTPEEIKQLQQAQQQAAGQDRALDTAGKVAQIAALGAKAKQGAGQGPAVAV